MNDQFNPIQILNNISDSGKSGKLQVVTKVVTWNIYLKNGKLQYAIHSLQSWEVIKYYLLYLGYEKAAKAAPPVTESTSNNHQLIQEILNQNETQGHLNLDQKENLMEQLAEDALESLLCVTHAQKKWYEQNEIETHLHIPNLTQEHLLELSPLISSLGLRLQKWQQLNPLIISPHQRPFCPDPSLLQKAVTSQKMSQTTSHKVILQLLKLMKGLSIRQLAIIIKQDELRLAQLLLPYIKTKLIQLYQPKIPLNRLPLITSAGLQNLQKSPKTETTQVKPTTLPPNITPQKATSSLKTTKEKCKIVCIDDSPIMLETIGEYLSEDKYELTTIDNPVKVASSLFKNPPDLILMDISMPSINGNRLCKILKASPKFKEIPIIFVSGNTKFLDQETLESSKAIDFLAKPFSKQDLIDMVNKHL